MNTIIEIKKFSQEQYKTEYENFKNSALWELKQIKKALNLMPLLNSAEENARLKAVKDLMRIKK
jgi:hypothetical protein